MGDAVLRKEGAGADSRFLEKWADQRGIKLKGGERKTTKKESHARKGTEREASTPPKKCLRR